MTKYRLRRSQEWGEADCCCVSLGESNSYHMWRAQCCDTQSMYSTYILMHVSFIWQRFLGILGFSQQFEDDS